MEMESAFDMLAEDPSGRGLKQLREELFEMRTDVKRAMDAGMDLEMPGISNGHREVLAAGRIPALDRGAEKVLQLLGRAEHSRWTPLPLAR